ncbi:hypothetical protein J2S11_002997 [Bacillus horti]|uniref:Uncharacterized protein n=1 Tax=Caldalkalibacillus horti TaxID=77523 RepID=A0ABT9W1F4_9BACI|nr:hypothetical protein [Bacillus horti]
MSKKRGFARFEMLICKIRSADLQEFLSSMEKNKAE